MEKIQSRRAQEEEKMERQFLDGAKDEELGVCRDIFSAKTDIEGQDGGVVSALLIKGLREGLFDAAVVVRRMEGYSAQAVAAETAEEVLAAKGTKYLKVNVTTKLRELISQGKKRIAVVCTPCEAAVIRKIQQAAGDCEITIIGLFCFGAFDPIRLKEEIKVRLGVDLDKADKTQVKQGRFTVQVEDREFSCKIKDLDRASERPCSFCGDFVSRLADVSVGSAGSKPGYSTVVVRSKKGERLVENLEATKEAADKQEITKLSKFKRERAKKSVSEHQNR